MAKLVAILKHDERRGLSISSYGRHSNQSSVGQVQQIIREVLWEPVHLGIRVVDLFPALCEECCKVLLKSFQLRRGSANKANPSRFFRDREGRIF